jgi:hypothetical protein
MKKMKIVLILLILTFAVACGQKPDDTFTKPVYFNQPVYLYGGFYLNGILYTTMPSGGVADWNTIINKPPTFPPSIHNHDLLYKALTYIPTWTEITGKPPTYPSDWTTTANKPGEIELGIAISQLKGIIPPRYTTVQIDALMPIAEEEGLEVYDLTLHVKKYWNGTMWKIIPTTN